MTSPPEPIDNLIQPSSSTDQATASPSTASTGASSIHCQNLSVSFGDTTAVDSVNLQVIAGEILMLVGPSGCGKTTLLRVLAGLQSPSQGSVQVRPPVAQHEGGIGFVFQQPTLLAWRTALANVMLPLELIGIPRREAIKRAESVLESVDLQSAHDRYPHELSGGMKMRVSIARALVTRPRILLLDEPFAALDDMLRNQLGQLLLRLWQRQRFTTAMVTHNIGEAILLSHHIAVMRRGVVSSPIANPLPWPRGEELRQQADFASFYGTVSERLRGES